MSENINMVDALHKTIYNQNQQIAELKKQLEEKNQHITELQKQLNGKKLLEDNYARLSERYDMLDSRHDALLEENLEYEEKIDKLQKQLEEKDKEIETKNIINNLYKTTVSLRDNDFKDLVYENNSLKQQLKSQPSEIVEKIGGEIYTRMVVECKETKYTDINLILDTILKEYKK